MKNIFIIGATLLTATLVQANEPSKISARCGVISEKEYIGEIFLTNSGPNLGRNEIMAAGKRVSMTFSLSGENVLFVSFGRLPTDIETKANPTIVGYDTIIIKGNITEKRFILNYQTKSESIYCHRTDVSEKQNP